MLGLVAAIVIAQQAAGPPLGRGHLARAQAAGWNQATGLISSLAAYTSLTLSGLGWFSRALSQHWSSTAICSVLALFSAGVAATLQRWSSDSILIAAERDRLSSRANFLKSRIARYHPMAGRRSIRNALRLCATLSLVCWGAILLTAYCVIPRRPTQTLDVVLGALALFGILMVLLMVSLIVVGETFHAWEEGSRLSSAWLVTCYLFGWLLLLAAAVVGRLRGTFTMVTIAFRTVAAIGLLSTSRVGPTRVIFETWTTKRFRRSITRIDGRMSDLATEGLNSRTDVSRLKRPGYSSFSPSSSRTHRRTPGGRYSRHRKDSSSASRTVVQRPGARQR